MTINFQTLEELLNAFGVAMIIDRGKVYFIDLETDTLLKSYYAEKKADSSVTIIDTRDPKVLFNGHSFYLDMKDEDEIKKYKFRINDNQNGSYTVTVMDRMDGIGDCTNIYSMKADCSKGFNRMRFIEKSNSHQTDYQSDMRFRVEESIDPEEYHSSLSVHPVLSYDTSTGYNVEFYDYSRFAPRYSTCKGLGLYWEEASSYIDSSVMFQKVLPILFPRVAEDYDSLKEDSYGTK